jgi:hypothetical protein
MRAWGIALTRLHVAQILRVIVNCRVGVLPSWFVVAVSIAVVRPPSATGQPAQTPGPQPSSASGQPAQTPAPQPYPANSAPNGAPAYPPSPYAPQPYPTSPPANCPACPPGTVCVNGTCAPAYPQCPPGTVFHPAGYCVPADYSPYPPNYESPMEAQARVERQQRRMRLKLTIDAGLEMGMIVSNTNGSPVAMPMFSPLVGICLHLAPGFGFIFRGGPLIGFAMYDANEGERSGSGTATEDSTMAYGFVAEVFPFFRTDGRFYWGALLSAMYMSFDAPELESHGSYVSLKSGITGAFGLAIGWLLGKQEKTALSFSAQGSPANRATILFAARIGLQL